LACFRASNGRFSGFRTLYIGVPDWVYPNGKTRYQQQIRQVWRVFTFSRGRWGCQKSRTRRQKSRALPKVARIGGWRAFGGCSAFRALVVRSVGALSVLVVRRMLRESWRVFRLCFPPFPHGGRMRAPVVRLWGVLMRSAGGFRCWVGSVSFPPAARLWRVKILSNFLLRGVG